MGVQALLDGGLAIVDTDSHVAEPVDLWTSRLPARFADRAPQVVWHEEREAWRWRIGDRLITDVAHFTRGDGWPEYPPSLPPTFEGANPGTYEPHARLARMDELGVTAQVLYPNIVGFHVYLMMVNGLDYASACVRAYNDFLAEFAAVDPDRLVPIAMLPFWDLDETIAEMRRTKELGHKGFLWANQFEHFGLPRMTDPYWAPVLSAAEDMELAANFHVGFASNRSQDKHTQQQWDDAWYGFYEDRVGFVRGSSLGFLSNVNCILDLTLEGVCARHPKLDFVCVESGFGYVPFLLESLDWQWTNNGAARDFPDRLLPSEYFRRQVFTTFWFETSTLSQLPTWADNVMFETDYPHGTSLVPGPCSSAQHPREHVAQHFADLPDDVVRKVLHDNAARVYHLR